MTTALWVVVVVAGFSITIIASSRAVTDATKLAKGSRLPPFFVGMTLLAVGTDLPEIANSIVASFTDNGDINVGDSIGSTATQLTLVFGLLPFAGYAIPLGEPGTRRLRGLQATAWLTALALVLVAVLLSDDRIGRFDAIVLIIAWAAGSRLVYSYTRIDPQLALQHKSSNRGHLILRLLGAVVAIGVGATLAVTGLTEIAELWGVPAFIIAYFGASIGTSLPELVVDITALRRGEAGLAIGDILGSSFVDATLSIAIGPLLFPTAIDGRLAFTGAMVALGAAVVVALLLGRGGNHDRRTGLILLLVYAASWPILL